MISRSLIVVVDPGNVCGIACLDVEKVVTSFELTPYECIWHIEQALMSGEIRVIVCESFIPRPGAYTWQPDAVYTIGALKYLSERASVPFFLQSPASAKKFSTNAKLDRLGWRNRTPGGHADDATRHLLLFASSRGIVEA